MTTFCEWKKNPCIHDTGWPFTRKCENHLENHGKVGQEHESEIEADLKTSKLLLFAPVVEGCDQNYNHLKLSSVKKKSFVFCFFPSKKTNTPSDIQWQIIARSIIHIQVTAIIHFSLPPGTEIDPTNQSKWHIISTVFSKNHKTSTVYYRILQHSQHWPLQARWRGPQSTPYCVLPLPRLEIKHCRKSSRAIRKLALTAHLILSLVLIRFRSIVTLLP